MTKLSPQSPCPCQSSLPWSQCCGPLVDAAGAQRQVLEHGFSLLAGRQWQVAAQVCQQVLQVQPTPVAALMLGGCLQLQTGNFAGAAQLLAVAIKATALPRYAACLHLGTALRKLGRVSESANCLQQAVAVKRDGAAAYLQLGLLMHMAGQTDQAIACYRNVVTLQSGNADAWNNLGMLLQGQLKNDDAEAAFTRALECTPQPEQRPSILNNLGTILLAQGRPRSAEQYFRQAIALNNGVALYHRNLAAALMRMARAEAAVVSAETAVRLTPEDAEAWDSWLFYLLYQPGVPAVQVRNAHRRFGKQFEGKQPQVATGFGNVRDAQKRLRVGYVSGDLRTHTVATLLEPVLANHNHQAVEIFCYATDSTEDAVTQRLKGYAAHWRLCAALDDATMANTIRADGIDILVDLSGHTAKNRLPVFARRVAPVQASWLGYPATTGLQKAMDYRLTDRLFDPEPVAGDCHTEQVAYLTRWTVIRPPESAPEPGPLPALTNQRVTFACLNNLWKINGTVIALWVQLLAALPEATLIIGDTSLTEERECLLERFAEAGIPEARLELMPRLDFADYLALHQRIDLALDPVPFCGGLTTYHALWMGVPVITLAGETSVSRQGAAILGGIGLNECIAGNAEDYVAKALELASDLPRLAALRAGLRQRMAVNTDGATQARDLEAIYRQWWAKWCGAA